MSYQIIIEKKAKKQIDKIKDKKVLQKIIEIIDNISQNPYSPEFKFERLKFNFSGFFSKRIDKFNRLIYQVKDEEVVVIIITVSGHYEG